MLDRSKTLLGAGFLLCLWLAPLEARALPPNTRQIAEGYWIGGAPSEGELDGLAEEGVRLVVSLYELGPEALKRAQRAGIRVLSVKFGMNMPSMDGLLTELKAYGPAEVYIHCEWGADRTGAVAAFLLVVLHGWTVDHALMSFVYPQEKDIQGLAEVLESLGYPPSEEAMAAVGVHSGASNGGTGGLKIRHENYRVMIRSTVAEMERHGARPPGFYPEERCHAGWVAAEVLRGLGK